MLLIAQDSVEKDRDVAFVAVGIREKVAEARARLKNRRRGAEDEVLGESGAVEDRDGRVPAYVFGDAAFVAQRLEHRRVGEPEVVEVGAEPERRYQVEIGAGARQDGARVVEVRLAL